MANASHEREPSKHFGHACNTLVDIKQSSRPSLVDRFRHARHPKQNYSGRKYLGKINQLLQSYTGSRELTVPITIKNSDDISLPRVIVAIATVPRGKVKAHHPWDANQPWTFHIVSLQTMLKGNLCMRRCIRAVVSHRIANPTSGKEAIQPMTYSTSPALANA